MYHKTARRIRSRLAKTALEFVIGGLRVAVGGAPAGVYRRCIISALMCPYSLCIRRMNSHGGVSGRSGNKIEVGRSEPDWVDALPSFPGLLEGM